MTDIPRKLRRGDPITARFLNALLDLIVERGLIRVEPPLQIRQVRGGGIAIGLPDNVRPFGVPARITGVHGVPGAGWGLAIDITYDYELLGRGGLGALTVTPTFGRPVREPAEEAIWPAQVGDLAIVWQLPTGDGTTEAFLEIKTEHRATRTCPEPTPPVTVLAPPDPPSPPTPTDIPTDTTADASAPPASTAPPGDLDVTPRLAPIKEYWDISSTPDPIIVSTRAIEVAPGQFEPLPVGDPRSGIGATGVRVTVSRALGTNTNKSYTVKPHTPGALPLDISKTINALAGAAPKSVTLSASDLLGVDAIEVAATGSDDSGAAVWVTITLDFG